MPTIKLTMKYDNRRTIIQGVCPASDALFQLLGRRTLEPEELNCLHRMGFEIEFVGDIKTAHNEIGKENLDNKTIKKEYFENKKG